MTISGLQLKLPEYLLLLIFALAVLAPGLTGIPPVDRDESRYAVASTQMLASGDFVDPRFQNQPRHLQPAGIYWLQSAATAPLSAPDAREVWTYRLPSLVAAVAAVLLTAWTAGFLFGRPAGLAAGLLLAVCFSLGFEARSAKTDAVLLASTTAAQLALLRIYLDPRGGRWRPALFWAASAVGVMVKGPIILLVSGSTILALLLWDRRTNWLKGLRASWGLVLFLAVVLPWHLAIAFATDGEFYARAIGRNLLGKVGSSQQSHAGPPGYHLALFPLAFWPASLFAVLAAPFAWRRRAAPAVRFLIAWILPTWLIFELVATKLPHYVLPTYPAIATLAAGALMTPPEVKAPWARWLGGAYVLLWLAVGLLLAALAPGLEWRLDGKITPMVVALAIFSAGLTIAAAGLLAVGRRTAALVAAALAGLVVWVNAFGLTLPNLNTFWMSPRIVEGVRTAAVCPTPLLVSTPYHEPSLVFLHGPDRVRLADSPEEAAQVMSSAGPCAVALVGQEQAESFLAASRAMGSALSPVGVVSGLNYSDGEALNLTLYAPNAEARR